MLSDTLLASKVLFKHSLLLFTSKRLLLLSTLTGKVELETNHTLNTPQAVVAGIFRISVIGCAAAFMLSSFITYGSIVRITVFEILLFTL